MTSPYPIDLTEVSQDGGSAWLYCPICCALYAGVSEGVPCPNTDQPDHQPGHQSDHQPDHEDQEARR